MISNFGNKLAKDIWETDMSRSLPQELAKTSGVLRLSFHGVLHLSLKLAIL